MSLCFSLEKEKKLLILGKINLVYIVMTTISMLFRCLQIKQKINDASIPKEGA